MVRNFREGTLVFIQWNEQQLRKQEQLESMKAQLEQQQKSLEEFQDAARKQGFGSSVYDP